MKVRKEREQGKRKTEVKEILKTVISHTLFLVGSSIDILDIEAGIAHRIFFFFIISNFDCV